MAQQLPDTCRVRPTSWEGPLKLATEICRKSGDSMNDLNANSLIWGLFMSGTVDAAVRLWIDYLENLHFTKIKHNER